MGGLIVPLYAIGAPTVVVIDGISYRPPLIDSAGHQQVDVLSTVAAPAPTSVLSGVATVTTAATRVQLAANACKTVLVKAHATNTGTIYVGGAAVAAANGLRLAAAEWVALPVDNTNRVYIDASVNGEGVSWLAVN